MKQGKHMSVGKLLRNELSARTQEQTQCKLKEQACPLGQGTTVTVIRSQSQALYSSSEKRGSCQDAKNLTSESPKGLGVGGTKELEIAAEAATEDEEEGKGEAAVFIGTEPDITTGGSQAQTITQVKDKYNDLQFVAVNNKYKKSIINFK
ncbi:hypothetical protein DSO57_1014021 [Entomophthora muscae]|uniref:Uncharacterized protein n=1 Tax=Entomophthora muscae TaxID=34485 RepID=A0ACC2T605_9FUNG|nr:hypothetical protein DSO57_1014021 [Entomophthora muscae]